MKREMYLTLSVWVFAFSVAVSLPASPSHAADNPLGTWRWDNDKTLREFKLPTEGSEQLKSDAAPIRGDLGLTKSTITTAVAAFILKIPMATCSRSLRAPMEGQSNI